VEVHNRFDDSWSTGFVIDAVLPWGYRVRRTFDQALLPDRTSDDDLRPARDRSAWS
jgi:hypothetical protein